MNWRQIEAAEEIQLLLPENQPEAAQPTNGGLVLGFAVLALALPLLGLRLLGHAPAADAQPAA